MASWPDTLPWAHIERDAAVLPRAFYDRPAAVVARDLLGKLLVHQQSAGVIVETEAYLGREDAAAHAARGLTPATRVIYGPPGRAYVYLIYGLYDCLNVVTEPEGIPGCVLIRAIEPVTGIEAMRRCRPAARRIEQLAAGPGRLTQALGITRALNGADLTAGPLTVRDHLPVPPHAVAVTPRIGISQAVDWPLRFVVAHSRFSSGNVAK